MSDLGADGVGLAIRLVTLHHGHGTSYLKFMMEDLPPKQLVIEAILPDPPLI
jgi:hypothetical protein